MEETTSTHVRPAASPNGAGTAAFSALPEGVSTFRVLYSDLHGVPRGKDVPLAELDRAVRGLNFCWAVMGTDLRHTPVVGGERGYPDMVAVPDLGTLRQLPYEPDVAVALADLRRDGEPEPTDMRHLVRRAETELSSLGLTAKVAPELEFFLCDRDESGAWRRHVDNLSMVYTVGPLADPGGMLKRMLDDCSKLGIGAIAANHEFMNSQYEINLSECSPLSAADNAFRFKSAIKDQAAQAGLHATFMGKPFNDQGGSGHHLHISLERDGANCFDHPEGPEGLSDELRHFTAGVLEHAPALVAFLNPTINAYGRILPDSLAPTHCNWGLDNRTTFVRIPPERGGGSRMEVRVGDGASNPYLVIAATLFAGVDGLRRELEPPDAIDGDAYAMDPSVQGTPIPATLEHALEALEADEMIRDALGADIVETFLALKGFELERFRAHTTDWEIDEYMHHL